MPTPDRQTVVPGPPSVPHTLTHTRSLALSCSILPLHAQFSLPFSLLFTHLILARTHTRTPILPFFPSGLNTPLHFKLLLSSSQSLSNAPWLVLVPFVSSLSRLSQNRTLSLDQPHLVPTPCRTLRRNHSQRPCKRIKSMVARSHSRTSPT